MSSGERVQSSSRGSSRSRAGGYLGLLISALCIVWVLRSVETDKVVSHLSNASIPLLLLATITTFVSYIIRSWRWQFFFDDLPPRFSDSFRCLIMGFFVNNILPARVGEFVRAHLGGRATNQSRSTVLATVAAERLADGLTISVLFSTLFCIGATAEEFNGARELTYVALMFLLAAISTAILLFYRHKVFNLLERLGQVMPGHLSTYTLIRIRRFIVGLEPLLKPSRLLLLSVLSAVVWGTELLVYFIVTSAFDYEMSIGGLALFLAAVNFSSLIPAGPGAVGVIEAFATLLLVRIGLERETAFSMVATQHLIQYIVIGLPGCYYLFLRMGGRIPKAERESEIEDAPELAARFADVSGPCPDELEQGLGPPVVQNGHERPAGGPAEVDFSVVIPAYNEEHRLPKTILEILEYFKNRSCSYEVIVVDDGSTDGTANVARRFESLSPAVRLITYPANRGKGYAVRFGVLNAVGDLILFDDADGATPIAEVERLEAAVAEGAQVAIGSRALFSMETQVSTVWYRKIIGRIFSAMVNMILLPGIADTQCGFKLFERKVAAAIFSAQREQRFSFDVEVLFLARKMGCKIAEVPVNWTNVAGSKVNLIKDSAAMFLALWRVRLRNVFGAYSTVASQRASMQETDEKSKKSSMQSRTVVEDSTNE